jgi:uncharacterized membrane protein YbhN (UPF0104 family)
MARQRHDSRGRCAAGELIAGVSNAVPFGSFGRPRDVAHARQLAPQVAGMKSRRVDKLTLAATGIIFCAAMVVLYRQFEGVRTQDVVAQLASLPVSRIAAALGLTAASYLLLTGYDFLALRYIGRRLRFRHLLFVSFTAFAFSNNLGVQLLSGGSLRYRIYSRFGLGAVEIGEIVLFCTVSYALGVVTVSGLLALFHGGAIALLLSLPKRAIFYGGLALIAIVVAYVAAAGLWRRPLALGGYRLRPPSLVLAVAQIALASLDAALAAAVLYVLLPADLNLAFVTYLGVYVIGATAGVLSLVPGGLGVFETAVMILMVPPSKAGTLGVFLVYRLIYFIVPLVIAMVLLAAHEVRRQSKSPMSAPR